MEFWLVFKHSIKQGILMKEKIHTLWCILKLTFEEFGKDKASTMAAAQAYFTVFALPPLLILLAMFLGLFLDDATIQSQIQHQAGLIGGQTASSNIQAIFSNAQALEDKSWWAVLISLGILIFSATSIFSELQNSLNTIWGVEIKPEAGFSTVIMSRVLGFGLILGLGALILLSMFTDIVLALGQNFLAERLGLTGWVVLFKILSFGLSFGLLTAGFSAIFWLLPDVKSRFSDFIIGSLFTSGLFTLSRFGLSLFLTYIDVGSAYGAAGTLMVFLFFISVSMQLFFLGAEFTEIYARSRCNALLPGRNAQWLPGRPRETERVIPAQDIK
jgi:membrane protein